MNENICARLIVSEATWIRQEWVIVQTFQDTHECWCHTSGALRYPYKSVFSFHTSSSFSPASYHSSGSGCSANMSWSTSACRNAVCTSIATVVWSDSGSPFQSCELAASIVFRDNVDGVGENISGCVRS